MDEIQIVIAIAAAFVLLIEAIVFLPLLLIESYRRLCWIGGTLCIGMFLLGLTLAGFFQLYHYALGDSARDAPTLEGFAVIVLTTLPPLFYTLIQLRWLKRRELKSNNPAQI